MVKRSSAAMAAVAAVLGVCGSGQGQARPAITGIAFARFYTTEPAAAQHFYGDTLGYQRKEVAGEWVYPVNALQWIEVTPQTPPKANDRLQAVGFTTRDAKGLERYLAAKGVKAEMPLREGEFGVRDPEGNLVIFVQQGAKAGAARAAGESAPSPHIASARIIHVGFLVESREREDAFWRDVLGFKPYWHGGMQPDKTDWVSVQVPEGSDWLEYMLNSKPDADLRQHGVMNHFSLGVTDMSSAVTALAANRCEGANCAKTQMGKDGKVQLNLFDPDLTRVEFMEFVPREKPCCSEITGRQPGPVENR